jgi:Tol biopolymer transport system component
VQQLTTPQAGSSLSSFATLLSWSPDGRYLQLSSSQAGLMTLWGPALLPHQASAPKS